MRRRLPTLALLLACLAVVAPTARAVQDGGAPPSAAGDDDDAPRADEAARPIAGPPAPADAAPSTADGSAPGGRVGADALQSLAKGRDLVVRELGGVPLTGSDVYRVLDLAYPALVEETVGEMLVTVGVRLEAEREGVDVPAEQLTAGVRRAMAEQQTQFARSVGGDYTFEQYLAERHGMDADDWEREARRMVLASLLRDRVVRLNSWRQPRDELQIILVSDEAVASEIQEKLAQQASFSALARQHSLHPSKNEGGLMPPLARDLDVPLVEGRGRLDPGEWLGPAPISIQDTDYLRFVRLVDRLPAETAPWSQLRQRIEASFEQRPVGPDELLGFEAAVFERYGDGRPAAPGDAQAGSPAPRRAPPASGGSEEGESP